MILIPFPTQSRRAAGTSTIGAAPAWYTSVAGRRFTALEAALRDAFEARCGAMGSP